MFQRVSGPRFKGVIALFDQGKTFVGGNTGLHVNCVHTGGFSITRKTKSLVRDCAPG
jgi:hypothetical protein